MAKYFFFKSQWATILNPNQLVLDTKTTLNLSLYSLSLKMQQKGLQLTCNGHRVT